MFGPLGGPEIIMILLVLFFLAAPVVLIIVLVKVFNKPKAPPIPAPRSAQEQLITLDQLRSENLITEAEHEEKRKAILKDL